MSENKGESLCMSEKEDEYQVRRRRIAEAFMAAYGRDLKNIDPKKLEELQRRREEHKETDSNSKPGSPYNIHTVIWLLGSFAVLYYTDLIPAVKTDHRIYRSWLYLGLILMGIHVTIGLYLIVVLSWIKKISDWEKASPVAIPVATATFVFGAVCLNIAIWPVYGFLTPLLLFTLFMGFIVTVSLLPDI